MKNTIGIPLLLILLGGLAGCGSDTNDNTGTPPPNNPPVTNPPPVEQPQTGNPPEEELPAQELPAQEPPIQEPPMEEPPIEEPPAEEPPTEEPVGALTLDPEVAAKGVAPNGSIVLIADRPLNAASVETAIELRDALTTERVPASVVYEGDQQRVKISPNAVLEAGKHYQINTSDLRDVVGNVVEIGGLSIARVKTRIYNRTIIYQPDGEVKFYTLFSRIPGSSEAMNVLYDGPGGDGAWFEGEDDVRHYETTQYLPGNVKITRKYEDAGEGDVWFDGNDVLSKATRQTYDDAKRLLEELVVLDDGDDDNLFTGDDDYTWAIFNIYDTAGRLLFHISNYESLIPLTPGADWDWLTADDRPFLYKRYEYDQFGHLAREIRMTKSADNEPFGDTDRASGYSDYQYDDNGQLAEIVPYGCDSQCFDGDDRVGLFFTRFHRIGATVAEETVYANDGQADDEDHDLLEYRHREYDEQGRVTKYGFFDKRGDDQTWHTPDDFSERTGGTLYSHSVDALGRPETRIASLDDNGADLDRFTGDEEIIMMQIETYDETSQLNRRRVFFGPGPTPGWDDGDEILFSEAEYMDIEE